MPALREAISRIFNPPPGREASIMRDQADRLTSAAAELDEHKDVLADLVRNVQNQTSAPRKKAARRRPSSRAKG